MNHTVSRVLIVDDMPINRMILSSLLATNGVISDQASSGSECLSFCENNDYDLILLDHRMPDIDGVDTLVALKEIFAKRDHLIPVVCHTTEEGRSNINLYKAAGFADVLIKPIDPRALSEVLMTYLPEKDRIAEADEKPFEDGFDPDAASSDISSGEPSQDELDKLPLWLKTVPHIDLVAGIYNCGSAEDYIDALYIFHSSIEEKSSEIEYSFTNEDWTMFRLCVHSLKSMARLVGARALYESSLSLEAYAQVPDILSIRRNTPEFLRSYRNFSDLLAPLKTDEDIMRIISSETDDTEPAATEPKSSPAGRTVMFVHSASGIVTTGIENHLHEEGYNVISIPDEPDMIITYRFEADIIVYYPTISDKSHIGLTMNLLGEICQDDTKILCLTGETGDIDKAMASMGAHRVSRTYPRPVNIHRFMEDMEFFSDLLDEFHRKKTLFIVDDDPGYLSVIEHWLSSDYNISCFSNGKDLLEGLGTATPDLIILDYEMPEMDGYEILKLMRSEKATKKIPVIFLTGKNDRDHVFRILEYKPDGYLLKTSQKDSLLDAIKRFFAETVFRRSL